MDEELRGSAAHVFVAPTELDRPDGPDPGLADIHHLARVLRLRAGEPVSVSDGAGRWRPCRWATGERLVVDGAIREVAQPKPAIIIGFTPVKGDRPEWTAQKLTELGVDRIIPLRSARSVVRWEGPRGALQVERLRRVVREASAQARRCHMPIVDEVTEPLNVTGAAMAHFGGGPVTLEHTTVLIGPEGGWTEAETAGLPCVALGPHVLRAETAAIVAGVLLSSLRTR